MKVTWYAFLCLCVFVSPSMAKVWTFQEGDANNYSGTQDTYLEKVAPDTNHGNDPVVVIHRNEDQGLISFADIFGNDPNQVPLGTTIESATLYLNVINWGECDATVHQMLEPWDESVTWGNSFGGDGVQADDNEAVSDPDFYVTGPPLGLLEIDVTESVQAWSDGELNYGWVLLYVKDDPEGWHFSSSEAPILADRPLLGIIPEPATLSLLAIGGLALMRRKRK